MAQVGRSVVRIRSQFEHGDVRCANTSELSGQAKRESCCVQSSMNCVARLGVCKLEGEHLVCRDAVAGTAQRHACGSQFTQARWRAMQDAVHTVLASSCVSAGSASCWG